MQRRSWIILAVCMLLAGSLFAAFLLTQGGPGPLTEQQAIDVTRKMALAFQNKNAGGVLAYISPAPDTRIANLNHDQMYALLVRCFHNTDRVSADMTNYVFTGDDPDAALQFDLVVHNDATDSRSQEYSGHITVHFRRTEVPQLLGLYRTKEWRIVGLDTTGPDPSTFGE